jgi:muramoyltetrapeptide carboxypeptidase LdcA involved in peptidoglycan recycling
LLITLLVVLFPRKLQAGDELRVVAPSCSAGPMLEQHRSVRDARFASLGLTLSYGAHVAESDDFGSSSVESRVADLHAAFADPAVAGIITAIGGYNANQLLPYLDWDLIRANPKVFCGYSDITALQNAMLARTGLVTYTGPHWSAFGMRDHFERTLDGFVSCLFRDGAFTLTPSPMWTDDAWYLDQHDRTPEPNDGWWVVNGGAARGRTVGGNLCTLNLLQGTAYMPSLADSILLVEDDLESQPVHFDRNLTSLLQQPGFNGVRGVLIGRFQHRSNMTRELLEQIVGTKRELANLPVIASVDFGHTSPMHTLPIGGLIELDTAAPAISVIEH